MNEIIPEVLQRGLMLGVLCLAPWIISESQAAESPEEGGQAAAESEPSVPSPILSVVFDDPHQLFPAFPEGIAVADMQSNSDLHDKDVATGLGGAARLDIGGGDREEGSSDSPKAFVLLSNPDEGVKSALRVNGNRTAPGTSGLIRITPEAVESSMAALSSFRDGKIFLDGGLDIFFRYSEDPAPLELKPFLFSSQGPGLHFVIHAHEESVIAFLNDSQGQQVFDTDLDGTADAERVDTTKTNSVQFDAEKFQHLAVWFQTAEDGTVTMKVFFKSGVGPIETADDSDLVSSASFRIITAESSKLLEHGRLTIGANSRENPTTAQADVAAFRLFAPAPPVFPNLAGEK